MSDDPHDPFDEFDDLFRSFDEAFEEAFGPGFGKVRELMERMLRQMEEGNLEPGKPFVYGFSLRMGPDGKPVIDDFGNTSSSVDVSEAVETREPLVDVIEGPDTVSVTVELPGVDKDDIDLTVTERELTIHVDAEARRYYKTVDLPGAVDPDEVQATYRNGVLDVTLTRTGDGGSGRRVPIE